MEYSNVSFGYTKNDVDFIKLFIENDADINFIVSEQTPLDVARQINNNKIINYLLANGAQTFREIED